MNKIALVIPYFGKFPVWIDLFLYSCSRNSFIDFIFYTDNDMPSLIYSNTIFHKITFKEYCLFVSKSLKINFFPKYAYKLCDLKCFYGVLHKEIISKYDFWGFGDLDLIYGDLSSLVNPRILRRYDLITTHADRIAGHFTLIRTKSKFTEFCYKIPNWQSSLERNSICGLDEVEFTKLVYPFVFLLIKIYRKLKKTSCIHGWEIYDFLSIPNRVRNLFAKSYFRECYTSEVPTDGREWFYNVETGKIMNWNNKEIPYLHFLFFKKTPFLNTDTYWKGDYWKMPSITSLRNHGQICFNNKEVFYLI